MGGRWLHDKEKSKGLLREMQIVGFELLMLFLGFISFHENMKYFFRFMCFKI
jgi:hypothetical protein